MSKDSLVPVEQKTVLFYEDEVTAVRLDRGDILVPIRPICQQLGVDWSAQYRRVQRDPVLNSVLMSVAITTTDIDPHSKRPKTSAMICLPIEYLNGWLFGISANRVKPDIRENLIRYQRECYKVLYDAMQDGRLTINTAFELSDDVVANAEEALAIANALRRLAINQLAMERQQRRNTAQLADHAKRIEELETTISSPTRTISNEQAQQVSNSVKAVAMIMSKQTKSNQYGAVYGELYRRYGITEYKLLPLSKFDDCMNWLNEWREQLESETF